MVTLEIGFNCMHLFAPEPSTGTMHVLMPATNGPDHDHAHGHPDGGAAPKHVVRMLHPSFLNDTGISMEDWELVLGRGADAQFENPRGCGELADITSVSNLRVPKALIETKAHERVCSRVTLRAGRMKELKAEAEWVFNGKRHLAYEATWLIEGLSPEDVTWNPLRASAGPVPPLMGLADNGVIRIRIFHVLETALPPDNYNLGTLDEAEIQRHFSAFYNMLDIEEIPREWLPSKPTDDKGHLIDRLNCVGVTAAIEGEARM